MFFLAAIAVAVILHSCDVSGTSVAGRTRDNLPLFAVGVVVTNSIGRITTLPMFWLRVITLAGYSFTAWLTIFDVSISWPLTCFVGLAGAAATFTTSVMLSHWRPATRVFAGIGQLSLEIYVAHVIFYVGTRVALQRVLGVNSLPVHLILGTLVGVVGPLLLVAVSRVVGFPYLFRWASRTPQRPQEWLEARTPATP